MAGTLVVSAVAAGTVEVAAGTVAAAVVEATAGTVAIATLATVAAGSAGAFSGLYPSFRFGE